MKKFSVGLTLFVALTLLASSVCFAAALREGDRGEAVKKIQLALIERGYLSGEADGVFGAATKAAVEEFQRDNELEADGICGEKTTTLLTVREEAKPKNDTAAVAEPSSAALREGDRGETVKKLQLSLAERGYLSGEADGVFGAATKAAVERFQRDNALEADGICGEKTLALLAEKKDAKPKIDTDGIAGVPSAALVYVPVGGVVKKGTYGDGVRHVQELLAEKGYLHGEPDGVCGDVTVHAIRGFQSDAHLTVDGIAGGETLNALLGNVKATDSRGGRVVFVRATAYSAFDPGNGGYTATGKQLRRGIIAVDPNFIPLGTRVYIPGYGEAIAEDIGGDIKDNRIDIAFDSHEEALAFGRQDLELYILD